MTAGEDQKFDVLNVNLAGKNLIEAAAGTGKTFSIAIMVLRWILGTEHTVDSVLAVTFTNYATAELKERILNFLEEALAFFETGKCGDKMIEAVCCGFPDKNKAEAKLKRAINDFDTASIFTIHGFCQKLIKEHAFELGIDFNMELSEDADTAGDAAVAFFRQNIADCAVTDENGRNILDEKKSREKISIKKLKEFISRAGIGVENQDIKIAGKVPFARQITEIYKDFAAQAAGIAENGRNRKNIMGFDDILLIIYEVLKDDENDAAKMLKKIMAERYSFVLIDEFQDTDPFQHFIFSKLFCNSSHTVFFIGDPKQSIYSFRKADIFSYIEAKKDVDNIYSMETNFRSSDAAVQAVNKVFGKKNIFGDDSLIEYKTVSAAKSPEDFSLTKNDLPFPGMLVHEIETAPKEKKSELQNKICRDISLTVRQMTNRDSAFKIREKTDHGISERAVRPSDIAILVAKNDFALEIYKKLKKDHVPAIVEADTAKQLSIFSSDEALSMQKLVAAAATGGIAEFKTLLMTFFYKKTVEDLADENFPVSTLHEKFSSCFEEWNRKGFYASFSKFLEDKEILGNVAGKGERTISILRQLAELIHKHESSDGCSPLWTKKWFNGKMKSKSSSGDEIIRTESEKTDCVRIMTLHKSKGLEFNIVFFPFILNPSSKEKWVLQHTKTDKGYKREMIFTKEQKIPGELPDDENLEEMRRIYVGITRAKYLTVCYTQKTKNNLEATSLFTDGTSQLTESQNPAIKEEETSSSSAKEEKNVSETELLPPEKAEREITPDWNLSSFTGIISSGRNVDEHAGDDDEDPESNEASGAREETSEEESSPMALFPKGTEVGIVLHKIFEKADFTTDNNSEIISTLLKRMMNFNSNQELENAVSAVSCCLDSVCSVPMFGNERTLHDVAKDDRTSEMEFFIAVRNEMQKGELSRIMSDNYRTAEIKNDNIGKGFLKGSIDLVVKVDGKYYIIDWKSNNLGSCFADYNEKNMKKEMIKHNYYLQYMLYLAAFDKYMTTVDPEYSYKNCFGGVRYVFLRGVKAGSTKTGIFSDRPDEQELRKIQQLFEDKA